MFPCVLTVNGERRRDVMCSERSYARDEESEIGWVDELSGGEHQVDEAGVVAEPFVRVHNLRHLWRVQRNLREDSRRLVSRERERENMWR